MKTLAQLTVRIVPEKIHFLKFILEGYDNFAILSTVDRLEGVVSLRYPPEVEGDVVALLDGLAESIRLGPP